MIDPLIEALTQEGLRVAPLNDEERRSLETDAGHLEHLARVRGGREAELLQRVVCHLRRYLHR